jgi:hypothetical protein
MPRYVLEIERTTIEYAKIHIDAPSRAEAVIAVDRVVDIAQSFCDWDVSERTFEVVECEEETAVKGDVRIVLCFAAPDGTLFTDIESFKAYMEQTCPK